MTDHGHLSEHLAIASVPMQQWGPTYEKEEALQIGTVFQALNMPFFAADDGNVKPRTPVGEEEALLQSIFQVSFVLDDMRLYMDTHPEDGEGLKLLKAAVKRRKELLTEFAGSFYPMTMDCMAEIYENNPDSDCYCWEKGPIPWEGVCV